MNIRNIWNVIDPPAVNSTGKQAVAYKTKMHTAYIKCFCFTNTTFFILTQVVQCLFCCQETILLVMYTKSG